MSVRITPRDGALMVALAVAGAVVAGLASGSWMSAVVGGACGAAALWVVRDPRAGLVAILVTLPLDRYGRLLERPVILTAYHAMLLLTLAAWAWRLVRRTEAVRWSAIDAGMAVLVFAGVWSLPMSMARGATVVAVVRVAFSAAFVLLFANLASDGVWVRRSVAAFTITAVASAVLAVLQYSIPGFPVPMAHGDLLSDGSFVWRAAALFEDPNYFGSFVGAGVVAFAAAAAHARTWARAGGWIAAAGVCGTALFLTLSRGSWVGVLAGLVAVAFTAPPKRRTAILAAGAALLVAVALLAPTAVRERALSSFDIVNDPSAATRWHMLGSGAAMARDHWLLGVGLGAYDKAYPPYRAPGTMGVTKPQDTPVSLVAETGLPGLAAEIAIIAGIVIEVRRRRGTVRSVLGSVAVAALVSFGAGMVFENYLYVEYLWLFVALAAVAGRVRMDDLEATG